MRNVIFLLLLVPFICDAKWFGPTEILSSVWGGEATEFYAYLDGYPYDEAYPVISSISDDGIIAISNVEHYKLYSGEGQWLGNVKPPYEQSETRVINPKFVAGNVVLSAKNMYFTTMSGELLKKLEVPGHIVFMGEVAGNLYVATKSPNEWLVYSPSGDLLKTFSKKPLELGHISDHIIGFQGKNLHKITVKYPDKEWSIVASNGSCGEYGYKKDSAGNLYCVGNESILRYSVCGKTVSQFSIPTDVLTETEIGPGVEPMITIVELYGALEMADNGDVYTSKVTQDGFSVLKWEWQDSPEDNIGGPDAPSNFKATSSETQVDLSWRPSLQDPGCVTGYEIERAATNNGPYTIIETVGAGTRTYTDTSVEAEKTYYYQMRALSAVENSPNTSEVSVAVP